MSEERFEVFGNIIKDNEDIPALLNNYQATVRLNELNDRIKELEQELAELKEKAIVSKFKVRQEVWWIDTRGNIYNKQNYKIDSYLIDSIVVTDNKFRYYGEDGCWLSEEDLFATEEEAQAKLKEMSGND